MIFALVLYILGVFLVVFILRMALAPIERHLGRIADSLEREGADRVRSGSDL